jgi:predicted metal-dependent hydrolase
MYVDNLNNVRRDASRNFRNKKKAYLKAKIEELETNRALYRGVNDFKKGYQAGTNIVKDEKGDMSKIAPNGRSSLRSPKLSQSCSA